MTSSILNLVGKTL